jgi:hypothetical protein
LGAFEHRDSDLFDRITIEDCAGALLYEAHRARVGAD